MGLMDVVTLPVRVTVAATQATLGIGHLASADGPLRRRGGYADRFNTLIVLADQLNKLLADPNGPVSLVNNLAAITSEERPLGRAIAPGGALDRVLAEDGVVEPSPVPAARWTGCCPRTAPSTGCSLPRDRWTGCSPKVVP